MKVDGNFIYFVEKGFILFKSSKGVYVVEKDACKFEETSHAINCRLLGHC